MYGQKPRRKGVARDWVPYSPGSAEHKDPEHAGFEFPESGGQFHREYRRPAVAHRRLTAHHYSKQRGCITTSDSQTNITTSAWQTNPSSSSTSSFDRYFQNWQYDRRGRYASHTKPVGTTEWAKYSIFPANSLLIFSLKPVQPLHQGCIARTDGSDSPEGGAARSQCFQFA